MKKIATVALTAALAFALVGPADAKKKPKKPAAPVPVDVQYFLRADEGCEAPYLSTTVGDADDSCYYGLNDTFNEYPQASAVSGDPVDHYVATDGVPLALDPTRKVTGAVQLSGWAGLGVGAAEVDVTLIGTVAGEEKVLGTYTEAYTAMPRTVHVAEFEITIDPAFAGVTVEGLTLDVWSHGNTVGGRGVDHNGASFVTIPAVQ